MSTEFYGNERDILEGERVRIKQEISDLGLGESGSLSYDPNFADTSQVTAERGEAEVLALELKGTLSEVEDALRRLEDGTYGRCIKCQQEIGSERLAALAMTSLCITCSSLD